MIYCLAAFVPCENLIFTAVLFINGLHLHVSIQIGKVSAKEKDRPLQSLFAFVDFIFDNFTKERALDLNSG